MARETTNQGYVDAQAYASDPDNVSTPDQTYQEYERGKTSYSLSQAGEAATLASAISVDGSGNVSIDGTTFNVDVVNNRVGVGTASPAVPLDVIGKMRASTGILFGTDTAEANALNDYEEGTWTPALSASGYTFTQGTRAAYYTKIGNSVFAKLYMSVTYDTGAGTVAGVITGLPFASTASDANYGGGSIFPDAGTNFFTNVPSVRVGPSSSSIEIGQGFSGAANSFTFNWATMGTIEFEVSVFYEVA